MICVVSCLQTSINVPHCHNTRKITQAVYSALYAGFYAVASFPFPLFYNSSLVQLLYIIIIYCCLYHFCTIYKLSVLDLREEKDYSKSTASKYKL